MNANNKQLSQMNNLPTVTGSALTNHSNLTTKQRLCLGDAAQALITIDRLIFDFEHSTVKDYVRLSYELVRWNDRLRAAREQCYDVPVDNIDLFNKGVYTGLVNPFKLDFCYFE